MSEPFIVPTVCQYTIHGVYGGKPIANVLGFHIDTTGSTLDRPSAIEQMGGVLLNQWHTDILPMVVNAYSATSVSWLDLNSDDGAIGSRTSSGGHNWPATGGEGLNPMAGNVSILVRKLVGAKRGARKGRMYVVGAGEDMTVSGEPNRLSSGFLGNLNTKFSAFLDNCNQENQGTASYSSKMVVIHVLTRQPDKHGKPNALPLTGEGLTVTDLQVDELLATQRRRLR